MAVDDNESMLDSYCCNVYNILNYAAAEKEVLEREPVERLRSNPTFQIVTKTSSKGYHNIIIHYTITHLSRSSQ